jgi:hypothetical protein
MLDLDDFKVVPGVGSPSPYLEYSQSGGVITAQYPLLELQFPDSVLTAAYFTTVTGTIGGTPAQQIAIDWYADFTGGAVTWGVQMANIPYTSVNVRTKALGTAVTTNTNVNATLSALVRTTLTPSDGAVGFTSGNAPMQVNFKIFRDGTAAGDTAVGTVNVRAITFLYQDT